MTSDRTPEACREISQEVRVLRVPPANFLTRLRRAHYRKFR